MKSLEFKRWIIAGLSFLLLGSLLLVAYVETTKHRADGRPAPVVNAENKPCVDCHRQRSPGVVHQWETSKHAENGIGCLTCHQAQPGDPDDFMHEGSRIATIVSPRDCSRCHEREFREQQASRHADAAHFVGSLDNFLGEIVEGSPAAVQGCQQCHGATVRVAADGRLDPQTWPNGGMGRINPDGTKGSCAACHYRHDFSLVIARSPETCGKCHMGPDHPQIEIYNESKHGVRFATYRDDMQAAMALQQWVVGVDYDQAPTCATCHMSATRNQPNTHDVGARISWTLRPVISTRLENWEERRESMLDVCKACHSPQWSQNYFVQFDAFVDLYNTKFAQPAQHIMDTLRQRSLITPTPFDEHIEWVFYELWHHEGRRGRHGAAMMGPDYVQWHGAYEVARNFYTEFIPEVRHLAPDLADEVMRMPQHSWTTGLSPEQRRQIVEFYRARYGAGPGGVSDQGGTPDAGPPMRVLTHDAGR